VTRIVLDPSTVNRLNGLASSMEFCDESGKVLGRFEPKQITRNGCWEPSFSQGELDAMESEIGGRSLPEILTDLRSRG
jgi:hypothetical protein